MTREITDVDGTAWTCAQAYAALESTEDMAEAARVKGTRDRVYVVCTPSGGAGTVRLQLPSDWNETYSDEQLLKEIQNYRD